MSSSLSDTYDHVGGDSPLATTRPFCEGHLAYDAFTSDAPSPPPIYVSGGGYSPDQLRLSLEANWQPFNDASDGPILPSLAEMQPEEGFALREWRRQSAIRLEEKEKRERALLSQIVDEADEYKIDFYSRKEVTSETNRATNREKEKSLLAGHEKFHTEADKNYWKTIAELIPNEVPAIEKKRGKKDQEENPSLIVNHGPKPGKPTDLSRMRHILLKLKHNTPAHLNPSPAPTPASTEVANTAAPPKVAVPEPVAVA
ncbi:hypothetical protein RJ639_020784 [Escallonia herrerae]|uniref:Clathrin light chain n=1 Tax=Escallonia herrerae TaxID=1293975 RepID=A0AA89AFX8_9ASTE|nr:hypothetical protein RJ639_020784 [Escallonia herrerae]